MREPIHLSRDVRDALDAAAPLVALESAVVTHGLPRPVNLDLARELIEIVQAAGVTPAPIAVLDGELHVGLSEEQLRGLAQNDSAEKLSARDLAWAIATGATGGTTVAAALAVCARLGIEIFATGGIGGVHPAVGDKHDVSADLALLARTRCCVVCAGAKAILDLPATLEHLDQLAVPVIGFGTDLFPQFFCRGEPTLPVPRRLDTIEQVRDFLHLHWTVLRQQTSVLLCNPVPEEAALSGEEVAGAIREAQRKAAARNVRSRDLTPFLLAELAELTQGRTLRANLALLRANAALAAQVVTARARGE